MSTENDEAFRRQLETERAALTRQLDEMGFGSTGEGQGGGLVYDPNFSDISQVTAERGEAANLAESLKESLDDVDAALAKIADGTFGLCEHCGKPISIARLEAQPAARRCIDCASLR